MAARQEIHLQKEHTHHKEQKQIDPSIYGKTLLILVFPVYTGAYSTVPSLMFSITS